MRGLKLNKQSVITNRTENMGRYFSELSKMYCISPERELELSMTIRANTSTSEVSKAIEELVCANLRFVVTVAKKYEGCGMSLEDLISEGNIGLYEAAQRFDATKGFKFISYAVYWINQSIMKALCNFSRSVRLPQNQIGAVSKLRGEIEIFESQHYRMPSVEELAHLLDMSEEQVEKLMSLDRGELSIDTPVSNESDSTLLDFMSDEEYEGTDYLLELEDFKGVVAQLLAGLSERERYVIIHSFGLGGNEARSLGVIGDELGLSRERVRQVRDRAVSTMRLNA